MVVRWWRRRPSLQAQSFTDRTTTVKGVLSQLPIRCRWESVGVEKPPALCRGTDRRDLVGQSEGRLLGQVRGCCPTKERADWWVKEGISTD